MLSLSQFDWPEQHRHGLARIVEVKTRTELLRTDPSNLKPVGMWLVDQFSRFQLPENVGIHDPWTRYAVSQIKAGRFFAVRCGFDRFHSNFTSLKKAIRRILGTDANLVELDVKNSQPTLLGIVTRHQGGGSRGRINPTPICDPKLPNGGAEEWNQLCRQGVIYEHVQDRLRTGGYPCFNVWTGWETKTIDPSNMTRDQVKKSFLTVMFAKSSQVERHPVYQVIRTDFPTVAETIRRIKRTNHKHLAAKLQRLEAAIVIDSVCESFRLHHPDEPVLTIHDALVVRESFAEQAERAIARGFERHGVTPTVERQAYGV